MRQKQRRLRQPATSQPTKLQPAKDHTAMPGNPTASPPVHSIKTIAEWVGYYLVWLGRRGLENHHAGKHKVAALYWLGQVVVVILIFFIPQWLFPFPTDISPGLRQFVFAHFNVPPPFGTFYPKPSLSPVFEIVDPVTGRRRPGIDGMVCYTNEHITVSVKLETRLDLLVFGWDGIQPYRMSNTPLEAEDKATGTFADEVQLSKNADDRPLTETIYVIGSSLPFTFDEVSAALQAGSSSARGGIPVTIRLPLRKDLDQHSFTCLHMN